MGVPKFAWWLMKKYPTMVVRDCPLNVHGLYIDLNGLIHPCCHDEDDPSVALRPEPEKLRQICLAVETLVVTTRPQHVIYIAVDGVAPRAKMNQQRARRYMSSAEPLPNGGCNAVTAIEAEFSDAQKTEAEKELGDVATALESDSLYGSGRDDNGQDGNHDGDASTLLPSVEALLGDNAKARRTTVMRHADPASMVATAGEDVPHFDSNCISPGTEFMAKVSIAVRGFLEEKLIAADPLWANATVIFSDANTPGEGEHKLLDFLRTQSSFSGFNGHGAQVIAGLDADLIFLSLSLHIPHVFILRDNKRPSSFDKNKNKKRNQQGGHGGVGGGGVPGNKKGTGAGESGGSDSENRSAVDDEEDGGGDVAAAVVEACTTYEYFDIDVVGASLVSEVYLLCGIKGFSMKADVRANSGGELVAGNGYCFDRSAGRPDGEKKTKWPGQDRSQDITAFHPCLATCNSKIIDDFIVMGMIMGNDFLPRVPSAFCGESVMDNIIEIYVSEVLPYGYLTIGGHDIDLKQLTRFFHAYAKIEAVKFRQFCVKDGRMTGPESACPLGSEIDERWRRPYYASTTVTEQALEETCRRYVEGMRFVWRYYSSTSEQVSWSWYYPFHHGPFAYDLYEFLKAQGDAVQTTLLPAKLETEAPETFAQQLCILPPSSKSLLPEIFRRYMTRPPEDLQETFPKEWVVDFTAAYGKDHLAAVMLPFANMDRLKLLVREFTSHLSDEERVRQRNNSFHLVLRRVEKEELPRSSEAKETVTSDNENDDDAEAKKTPAAKCGAYTFEIQGKGVSPLPASKLPTWQLRTDCPALQYYQLRETQPELCRPRTYSFNMPIFNLITAEDGKVVRINNRKTQRDSGPGIGNAGKASGGGGGRGRGKDKATGKGGDGGDEDEDGQMTAGRAVALALPNYVEFAVAAGGLSLFLLLCTTPLCSLAIKVQAIGLLVASIALAYIFGFAVGSPGNRKGSGVHRNNIRFTFVDWQCGHCLCLNFSRNNRCFVCAAPFDEHHDWALFSGKNPPDPPLMDPDHSKYLEHYGRVD